MYKIEHSKEEIQIIYNISDNKETQKRLMSLLSYYKKYSIDGVLKVSLNKLYSMYLRYHNKITRSYFYKLMNQIKESFFAPGEDKVEDTLEDKTKVSQSVDTTDLESNFEKPNNKHINNLTNTITVNTNPTEFVSPEKLIEIARGLFAEFKIKSKAVKEMVLSKLNLIHNIRYTGAVQYVTKVIAEKKAIQEAKREMYYRLVGVVKEQKVYESQAYHNKVAMKEKYNGQLSPWEHLNNGAINSLNNQNQYDYEELYKTGQLI